MFKIKTFTMKKTDVLVNVKWKFSFSQALFLTMGIGVGFYATWFLFSGQAIVLAICLFFFTTGVGFTVGYHRLLFHQSFETSKTMLYLLCSIGCLAGIGGPIKIFLSHNLRDYVQNLTHCPYYFSSRLSFFKSLYYFLLTTYRVSGAIGVEPLPTIIANDTKLIWLDKNHWALQIWLWVGLWILGDTALMLWAGPIRVIFTMLLSAFLNYFTHTFGTRAYTIEGADESGFNLLSLGILMSGEGWHNYHHAFPRSAKFGQHWWQIDFGYYFIWLLEKVGLAWNIKLSDENTIKPNAKLFNIEYSNER
jgi:sn-1 stearoyl-lipid 9-desaturase